MRRYIIMVKTESPNLHSLKDFWKTLRGVPARSVFCSTSLMDLSSPILLKITHIYCFHRLMYFRLCWFRVIIKDPYFTLLSYWNVKKQYVCVFTNSDFRNKVIYTIKKEFQVFSTDSNIFRVLIFCYMMEDTTTNTFISYKLLHK